MTRSERRWVDLSHPVVDGLPVYPGDPPVRIESALTAAEAGVNVLRLHLGSHSGTHVDAPFHVRDDLPRLDDVPLGRFAGPAVIVDARRAAPREAIGLAALEPVQDRLAAGVIVLVATGWSRYWGSPDYFAHPYPAVETATRLIEHGVRTLGVDTLSVDRTPGETESFEGLPVHHALAGAGCVIAENLRGLDTLLDAQAAGATIEVSLFPLALARADGAPVRAVAAILP
jgi:kynurenine formamidase